MIRWFVVLVFSKKYKISKLVCSTACILFTAVFVMHGSFLKRSTAGAVSLSSSQVTVGATYYGGEYNGQWVIDNVNQCSRIAAGEFTAASLNAVVDTTCDDDNGLTYQNNIPLHNTVSFAELSNNPNNPDYAAMGGLAAGTRVEIEYKGKCVVAEKRDTGQGGSAVNGHQRAIDLWWQTARSLGFTNGFDTVKVRLAGSVPLSPLGGTSTCMVASQSPAAPKPKAPTKPPVTSPPAPVSPKPQASDTKSAATQQEEPVRQSIVAPNQKSPTHLKFVIGGLVALVFVASLIAFKIIQSKKRLKKTHRKKSIIPKVFKRKK